MTNSQREDERLFQFGQDKKKTPSTEQLSHTDSYQNGVPQALILFTPTHEACASTLPLKNYSISLVTELFGSLELARLLLKTKYN